MSRDKTSRHLIGGGWTCTRGLSACQQEIGYHIIWGRYAQTIYAEFEKALVRIKPTQHEGRAPTPVAAPSSRDNPEKVIEFVCRI